MVGEYLGENSLAHNVHVKDDFLYVSHYTSGLLIGAEIASGISIIGSAQKSMVLLGSDSLIQRYELAFSTCGINVDIIGLEAVGSAYIEIARSAGLVR